MYKKSILPKYDDWLGRRALAEALSLRLESMLWQGLTLPVDGPG